jgi:hypothetical protein
MPADSTYVLLGLGGIAFLAIVTFFLIQKIKRSDNKIVGMMDKADRMQKQRMDGLNELIAHGRHDEISDHLRDTAIHPTDLGCKCSPCKEDSNV